jgi:hypothetical protein
VKTSNANDISDDDWGDLRSETSAAFLKAIDDWRERMRGKNSEMAMVALTVFLGHMLAGLAVELGVARDIDADGTGEVIADHMGEQLLELRVREGQGATLQ